ncbi:hypothetical protein DAEQUDRAFT_730601 [Daedalea quercina L-15889]|uniref:Uncharacterized protein n=1 Tax=Daedalea quercina L-15889 TaxID=1314783 RepID=A0A165MTS6_9APHY|nr:hypothetical protein DAEQUDRAFT_730601 [Daedalea quercina L-15889]
MDVAPLNSARTPRWDSTTEARAAGRRRRRLPGPASQPHPTPPPPLTSTSTLRPLAQPVHPAPARGNEGAASQEPLSQQVSQISRGSKSPATSRRNQIEIRPMARSKSVELVVPRRPRSLRATWLVEITPQPQPQPQPRPRPRPHRATHTARRTRFHDHDQCRGITPSDATTSR